MTPATRSKQYFFEVYDIGGVHKGNLTGADFDGFEQLINGSVGVCNITLNTTFLEPNVQGLDIGTEIRIYMVDNDTILKGWDFENRLLIYRGLVTNLEAIVQGGGRPETIKLECTGFAAILAKDIYKNSTTTTITQTATVGNILKDIIDRYQLENPPVRIFTYDNLSVDDGGISVNYIFEQKTYLEAIKIAVSLGQANYYYYIDVDGTLTYKQKADEAQHTFAMDKHFVSIKFNRDWSSIRNALLFWDGQPAGTYKQFSDPASIGKYRRLTERIVDSRLTDSSSITQFGNTFISEKKQPSFNLSIEIFDNNYSEDGYDIESIRVGQTCNLVNIPGWLADYLDDNMLIKKVVYKKDRAEIEVESGFDDNLINRIVSGKERLDSIESSGIPSTYTT